MACDFDDSPLGVYHFEGSQSIPQGATWIIDLTYKENDVVIDLSTYTARMQIREDYDQPVILELTTENGGITVGAASPNVQLNFSPAFTTPMTTYDGMIYDLELTAPAGTVLKFLEGRFSLRREVTK